MSVPPIIIEGEDLPDNLIVLHAAIRSYEKRKCEHRQIVVDPLLNEVLCGKCGEKLNPISILARFQDEQNLWWHRAQQYNKERNMLNALSQEVAEKARCKCEHCKKMTRIDRRVPVLREVK